MRNFSHKFIQFLTNHFKPRYKFHYYKSELSHFYLMGNRDQLRIFSINNYQLSKFLTYIRLNGSIQLNYLIFTNNCNLIDYYKIKFVCCKLLRHHMQNLVIVDCLQQGSHNKHSRLHHGTQRIYYSNIKYFGHNFGHF